ncbi:MAG: aminopeptidase [Bacteroidota bacterium]
MNTVRRLLLLAVAALCSIPAFVRAGPGEGGTHETTALARKLVEQCARIHEGDMVLISGGVRDLRLLEDIAVHVRTLGASPLLSIETERVALRTVENTPARFLSTTPDLSLKLAEIITAQIDIDASETQGLFSHIPPERMQAMTRAFQPVMDMMMKRSVRFVHLGNGLYPTSARARQFGISLDDLTRMFWEGLNVDYAKMQATGEAVRKVFAAGRVVRLTNPNGTDLTVTITGRPVQVSDGVISDNDLAAGGPSCQVWLPAGEVYLAPVSGTAQGKVVVDHLFYEGSDVKGLTMTLARGKVTSLTTASGGDALQKAYRIAGEGKDEFAFIDVGINPNVRAMPGTKLLAWMASGIVSVGIGGNTWAGGSNTSAYSLAGFLPGSTIKVDDVVVVDRGKLVAGGEIAEIPVTTRSGEARQNFLKGRELMEALRAREAMPYLEKAITVDPEFALAHYSLASARAIAGMPFMEELNRAAAVAGMVSDGERMLIEAWQADVAGNTAKGIELLRSVVARYPDDARARALLSTALWSRRDADEAIATVRSAIAIDPQYAPAYNWLGYLCTYTERFPEAERAFQQYIALQPNEPNPRDSYAELLLKEGKFDESIAMYEKVLALNPQFTSAVIGIANNFALKGLPAEARKRLQTLYDTAPDDAVRRQALRGMMLVSLHEGKFERALQEARQRQALSVKTNDPLAIAGDLTTIGRIALEMSTVDLSKGTFLKMRTPEAARIQEAEKCFEEAWTTIEGSTMSQGFKDAVRLETVAARAEIALNSNNLTAAKQLAEECRVGAATRSDASALQRAQYLLGCIAQTELRHGEALAHFTGADVRSPRTLLRLAEVHEAMGNTARAKEYRERVAHFNEDNFEFALVRATLPK